MTGWVSRCLSGVLALVLVTGCLGPRAKTEEALPPSTVSMSAPAYFSLRIPPGEAVAKVQNVVLLQDASTHMDGAALQTSKNLLASLNQRLPDDLQANIGLFLYGQGGASSPRLSERIYGMYRYSFADLQQAIAGIKTLRDGGSFGEALLDVGAELQRLDGTAAVMVISDGQRMDAAPAATEKIKALLGDKLCVYTIHVGNSAAGAERMEQVAHAGGCGFAESAQALTGYAEMAGYLERTLLTPLARTTPEPATADRDGDGIADNRDRCPATPRGEFVDADGCSLKLTLHINFESGRAEIKSEHDRDLIEAANFIQRNYKVPYILIAGHTDNIGSDEANQALSLKRAQNVRQALIDNYGINPDRLGAKGYGKTQPVATNDTDEGRYQNRRVEVVCCVLKPE